MGRAQGLGSVSVAGLRSTSAAAFGGHRPAPTPASSGALLVQSREQLALLQNLPADGARQPIYSNAEYAAGDEAGREAIDRRIRASNDLTARGLVQQEIYEHWLTASGRQLVAAGLPAELPGLTSGEALALIDHTDLSVLLSATGDQPDYSYDSSNYSATDVAAANERGYTAGVKSASGWVADVLARVTSAGSASGLSAETLRLLP